MSRVCTICARPDRAKIDAAFVAGTPYRSIAKQFHCSEPAMYRHTAEHITQEVKQSEEAKAEARGLDVVKQLKTINGVTLAILQEARKKEMPDIALKAIDRVTRQLELQAKLTGVLDAPQASETADGVLIPFASISARTRMEIRRLLVDDEQQRREGTG